MFEAKVSGNTFEDFKANISALAQSLSGVDMVPRQMDLPLAIRTAPPAPAKEAPETKSRRGRQPKAKESAPENPSAPTFTAEASAGEAAAPAAPAAAPETAPAPATAITMADLRAALKSLIELGEDGSKRGMAILTSFGATNLSGLKPEDYAVFVEKVTAAKAG